MAMTYAEQLKHPKWQRRRLETLNRLGFRCVQCGTEETTLHVHHLRYVKGRKVWEYEDRDLTVLCESCHGAYHDWRELLDELVAALPPREIGIITAIVGGYVDVMGHMGEDEAIHKVGTASSPYFLGGHIAAHVITARDNCEDREAFADALSKIVDILAPLEKGEI